MSNPYFLSPLLLDLVPASAKEKLLRLPLWQRRQLARQLEWAAQDIPCLAHADGRLEWRMTELQAVDRALHSLGLL